MVFDATYNSGYVSTRPDKAYPQYGRGVFSAILSPIKNTVAKIPFSSKNATVLDEAKRTASNSYNRILSAINGKLFMLGNIKSSFIDISVNTSFTVDTDIPANTAFSFVSRQDNTAVNHLLGKKPTGTYIQYYGNNFSTDIGGGRILNTVVIPELLNSADDNVIKINIQYSVASEFGVPSIISAGTVIPVIAKIGLFIYV